MAAAGAADSFYTGGWHRLHYGTLLAKTSTKHAYNSIRHALVSQK